MTVCAATSKSCASAILTPAGAGGPASDRLPDRTGRPSPRPVNAFLDRLPTAHPAKNHWAPMALPDYEGIAVPSQVHYVGLGLDLTKAGWTFDGADLVAARFLRMAYLWDRVRVRGGAYGAFFQVDRFSGVAVFGSLPRPQRCRHGGHFPGCRQIPHGNDLLRRGTDPGRHRGRGRHRCPSAPGRQGLRGHDPPAGRRHGRSPGSPCAVRCWPPVPSGSGNSGAILDAAAKHGQRGWWSVPAPPWTPWPRPCLAWSGWTPCKKNCAGLDSGATDRRAGHGLPGTTGPEDCLAQTADHPPGSGSVKLRDQRPGVIRAIPAPSLLSRLPSVRRVEARIDPLPEPGTGTRPASSWNMRTRP